MTSTFIRTKLQCAGKGETVFLVVLHLAVKLVVVLGATAPTTTEKADVFSFNSSHNADVFSSNSSRNADVFSSNKNHNNATHEKITFYRDPNVGSSRSSVDYYDDDDVHETSVWDIPIDTEHIQEITDADYYHERERYDEFEREVALEFRPLCSTIRRRISLKDDLYEYRPSHFTEVLCRKFQPLLTYGPHGYHYKSYSYHKYEQQCAYDGFKCIQRSQVMYLSRRRRDGDCWETTRQVIPSGCDCMWPISTLGEIKEVY
ncbi:unnamed protein product [Bemisia tabaci]|uniref:Spaetzle domain-containing protein n=1 Tax=Bemisia tabaci TaxID=7038 RepID=A0A9N9ZXG1_BEMTA|nr:unnamed protein product [Bemisia tabaci]